MLGGELLKSLFREIIPINHIDTHMTPFGLQCTQTLCIAGLGVFERFLETIMKSTDLDGLV